MTWKSSNLVHQILWRFHQNSWWTLRTGEWLEISRWKDWKRRCRIVAREYRDGQTNEDQYSPTSSFSSVRLLLVMSMLYDLSVTALDVKDAFLVVDQKEVMFVVIPERIRELAQDEATHWLLLKCLPGQRNAALRWNEHFTGLCSEVGMEAYAGCSTIMRLIQGDRRIYLSVHVDDIILICKPEDVDWFCKDSWKNPHYEEGWTSSTRRRWITLLLWRRKITLSSWRNSHPTEQHVYS